MLRWGPQKAHNFCLLRYRFGGSLSSLSLYLMSVLCLILFLFLFGEEDWKESAGKWWMLCPGRLWVGSPTLLSWRNAYTLRGLSVLWAIYIKKKKPIFQTSWYCFCFPTDTAYACSSTRILDFKLCWILNLHFHIKILSSDVLN